MSPAQRDMSYRAAINLGLAQGMERDPKVVSYGQDVGAYGGVFQVTRGLTEKFGAARNFDTPISEAAIAGAAVGMALTGLRPVAELQFADFFAIAMDEIYNKAAKWRYMHGGKYSVPAVFRLPMGIAGGAGAEHSQCPEVHFMHCPGLRVVAPATPADAKGLLLAALRSPDPVVFLEHKGLYGRRGPVPQDPVEVPIGPAEVRRVGRDVTLVSWSLMLHTVLDAAAELAASGVDAEVIDLRTLQPVDRHAILASVRKTGRLVIVHEAPVTAGPGAEISAFVAEHGFAYLRSPIRRVGGLDVPMPPSAELERRVIPSKEAVCEAVRIVMRQ